jgi:hypothetical protein
MECAESMSHFHTNDCHFVPACVSFGSGIKVLHCMSMSPKVAAFQPRVVCLSKHSRAAADMCWMER